MRKLLFSTIRFFLPQDTRDVVLGLPLVFGFVFVGYSLFLDRNPSSSVEPTLLVTQEVQQGDLFRVRYHVNWNSSCRVTGYRVIVDSGDQTHTFEPDSRFVMRGEDEFEISLRVPTDAFPGPARYEGYVNYECNWLQRLFPLSIDLEPQEFTILKAPLPVSESLVCPFDKPVVVSSYCRALPNTMASFLD